MPMKQRLARMLCAALAVAVLCGTATTAAAQLTDKPPEDGKEVVLTLLATGRIDGEKATRLSFVPIEMNGVEIRKLEGWLLPAARKGEKAPLLRIKAELVFENGDNLPAAAVSIEGIGSVASLQHVEVKANRGSGESSGVLTHASEVDATITAPEDAETVQIVTTIQASAPGPSSCEEE